METPKKRCEASKSSNHQKFFHFKGALKIPKRKKELPTKFYFIYRLPLKLKIVMKSKTTFSFHFVTFPRRNSMEQDAIIYILWTFYYRNWKTWNHVKILHVSFKGVEAEESDAFKINELFYCDVTIGDWRKEQSITTYIKEGK